MLEKKTVTITVDAEGTTAFPVGKITVWKDSLYLFDSYRPRYMQVLPGNDFRALPPVDLEKIAGLKQIDAVLFYQDHLLITDSLENTLIQLSIETQDGEDGNPIEFRVRNRFPVKTGAQITAAVPWQNNLLLLDKNHSMLRLFDDGFNEIKTVGSRMGYMPQPHRSTLPRLGFEFPEDFFKMGDRLIVSDSGNQRLVVLDSKLEQESIIPLPEYPFKFLCGHEKNRWVAVSDFDRSVMFVSLDHGFMGKDTFSEPVDFFSTYPVPGQGTKPLTAWTGTENREPIQLIDILFRSATVEDIAVRYDNSRVRMSVNLAAGKTPEAREILDRNPDLLPDFVRLADTLDDPVNRMITDNIRDTWDRVIGENDSIVETVHRLSLKFIDLYARIPESDDKEALSIDRENIRREIFLEIKKFRANLAEINGLGQSIKRHPLPAEELKKRLDARFDMIKTRLPGQIEAIETALENVDEKSLLHRFTAYWFLAEEEQVWFKDREFEYPRLRENLFLTNFYNEFYYHLSYFYLNRDEIDLFIRFCDREITMYPDKEKVIDFFIKKLIHLEKYDDVFRLLKKFPDPNRENVNFYYYQVYCQTGEIEKAFDHIKKELELFPNRIELIPHLIRLNLMDGNESKTLIDKILEKSAQSIDIYYNAALAFMAIGDDENASRYLDKELLLFPENQRAINIKLIHLLKITDPSEVPNHPEITRLVERLKAPQFPLTRSRANFALHQYRASWQNLKDFLTTSPDNSTIKQNLYLTESLNHLELQPRELRQLEEFAEKMPQRFNSYQREIWIYLSYIKNRNRSAIQAIVEEFDDETYLSACSTYLLAYRDKIAVLERLINDKEWEPALALSRKILKFNPGDPDVFRLLENGAA